MIPFPGESSPVDKRFNLVGAPVAVVEDVQLRAGSSTFTAGDSVKLVSNLTTRYLDDPAGAVVSWVVEVASGSGVLSLSEGLQPTSGSGEPAATSLGSHTVTGPTTLVVPSVAITAADVFDYIDYGHLHLTCDSGAVEVQQVKLRVWPVGGAAGGWGDPLPGFNTAEQNAQVRYISPAPEISGSATGTDPETVWDDAYAAFTAALGAASGSAARTIATTSPGTSRARQGMSKLDLAPTYAADHSLITLGVVIFGADWTSANAIESGKVEGVDWIVPPNEVPADITLRAQQLGAGSVGWANAVATTPADDPAMPGTVAVTSVGGDYTPTGPSLDTVTVPILHGGSAGSIALDTSGDDIYVSASHTLASGDAAAWPGWVPGLIGEGTSRSESITLTLGVGGVPVRTYAILPPYRVWSPTAVVEVVHPLRLMQRGDGLGMGSGRVLSTGTRQNSTRLLGSL